MLTREQALLIHLIEEAAEVQQRATKALRFGMDEVQPGQALNNRQRLVGELRDMNSVIRMLQDDESMPGEARGHCTDKVAKVEKYLAYSRELGEVE